MEMMPQQQSITVNGIGLAYYEWGSLNMPTLICLHSHTSTATSWREFAEFASSGYHVLALDQRGHGNSEWSATGYTRDHFVEDLSAFVNTKKLNRFTLVGCSMGGWNSILYAHAHPNQVEKIVMVDIGPEPSTQRLQSPQPPPLPIEFNSFIRGFEWLRSGNGFASDERLMEDAKARLCERADGKWVWKADLQGFDNPLPDMTDPVIINSYWDAIQNIGCPILEIRRAESDLVSDETLESMKKVGYEVSSVDVPNTGHVVMVDRPTEFITSIKKFLNL